MILLIYAILLIWHRTIRGWLDTKKASIYTNELIGLWNGILFTPIISWIKSFLHANWFAIYSVSMTIFIDYKPFSVSDKSVHHAKLELVWFCYFEWNHKKKNRNKKKKIIKQINSNDNEILSSEYIWISMLPMLSMAKSDEFAYYYWMLFYNFNPWIIVVQIELFDWIKCAKIDEPPLILHKSLFTLFSNTRRPVQLNRDR